MRYARFASLAHVHDRPLHHSLDPLRKRLVLRQEGPHAELVKLDGERRAVRAEGRRRGLG